MINEDNKEYCLKKEKKIILCEKFAFCPFSAPDNTIPKPTFISKSVLQHKQNFARPEQIRIG